MALDADGEGLAGMDLCHLRSLRRLVINSADSLERNEDRHTLCQDPANSDGEVAVETTQEMNIAGLILPPSFRIELGGFLINPSARPRLFMEAVKSMLEAITTLAQAKIPTK